MNKGLAKGLELEADKRLKGMSLKEKIGQLFFCATRCYRGAKEQTAEFKRMKELIKDYKIGGLIIFHGEANATAKYLNELQMLSKEPLLVGSDMERGGGQILKGLVEFPTNMAIGATGNYRYAKEHGQATGEQARAVGIHIVYGPVCDVNGHRSNQIINTRSYGDNAEEVSKYVREYIRGLEGGGNSFGAAKHFPGHGGAEEDSHTTLARLNKSKEELYELELKPFKAAILEGISHVMTGHISVKGRGEGIVGGDDIPCTLSKELVSGLLKGELGYSGLVVSDALNMGGVLAGRSLGVVVVDALVAGVDILLYPELMDGLIEAVEGGIDRGVLIEEEIDEKVKKILKLKLAAGLYSGREVCLEGVKNACNNLEHKELAKRISEDSLTYISGRVREIAYEGSIGSKAGSKEGSKQSEGRRKGRRLDIRGYKGIRCIIYDDDAADEALALGGSGKIFVEELRARGFKVEEEVWAFGSGDILCRMGDGGNYLTMLLLYSKIKAWKGRSGLSSALMEGVNAGLSYSKEGGGALVVSFGSPYIYTDLEKENLLGYIAVYSQSYYSQESLARVLCEGLEFKGRLPIKL